MKRNETTGRAVAHTAGLILGAEIFTGGFCVFTGKRWHHVTVEDILAMAGSLVTQSADHADMKAGKIPRGHRRVKLHKPVRRRMMHK